MSLECPDCFKWFVDKISLRVHLSRYHRKETLSCCHCRYSTKAKYNLVRHMKIHESGGNASGRPRKDKNFVLNCCLCSTFHCKRRVQMLEHYTSAHDVLMNERSFQFNDTAEFLGWKTHIEESESFRFVKNGTLKASDHQTVWYRCYRDGFFNSRGKNKRRPKIKGSCKINSVCPCSIKVVTSKNNGAVTVRYISRHVGHDHEPGRKNCSSYVDQIEPQPDLDDIELTSYGELIITEAEIENLDHCDDYEPESDHVSEIVQDLPVENLTVEQFSRDIEKFKESLSTSFATILQNVENMEQIDVIRQGLASILPTMKAISPGPALKSYRIVNQSSEASIIDQKES